MLLLMLHLQQELFLILQDTLLNLDMILHQFPLHSAQIDRFLQTTIVMIILKLPINITIHLIITFILHQTQLPIQISTKIILKLKQLQQHKTLSYNYHIPLLHGICILKIKNSQNFVSFHFLFSYHTSFSKETSKPSTYTYTN